MDYFADPMIVGHIAITAFLSIVFLQSGIDKVVDWGGNLEWLESHFSKSFLGGFVKPMLATLTLAEIATGLMSACALICVLFCEDSSMVIYAIGASLVTYLMLLFGQRIAKDYDGAKTIAIYFAVSLLSLLFL